MQAKRIVSVVGTRPEAIKMAPVVRALAEHGFTQQILLTGQHSGLSAHFSVPVLELGVDPREQALDQLRQRIHTAICGHLVPGAPDLVLVQGDTLSALSGALAAKDCGVPLGHVEAGLRSFDLLQPWPEEGYRIQIDELSDLLFAPTETAAANLAREPRVSGAIFTTGNTGTDALLQVCRTTPEPANLGGRKTILVTCHRKENLGAGVRHICAALKRLVRELPVLVVLPLHLNRHVRAAVEQELEGEPEITITEPLDYPDMVALIRRSWLILTDSGGLQEEGPALGKPVLVLRNVTERSEAGANIELVGTDPERIFAAVAALLGDPDRYAMMSRPAFPFGDGYAAPRIAEAIQQYLLGSARALAV